MNKEQFLAMSLPHELKGYVDGKDTISGQNIYILLSCHYKATAVEVVSTVVGESDFFTDKSRFKPILHPLTDLTKPIEHNGEMLVPINELCNLYGAKFDKPYQNDMCAGFIYGFAAHDVLNLKNIEKNEFWQIHKLIEWHFDIAGLIEKGEAIDVNTLPENPYK